MNTPTEPAAFVSDNPGRDVQRVGTARSSGQDVREDPRAGLGRHGHAG